MPTYDNRDLDKRVRLLVEETRNTIRATRLILSRIHANDTREEFSDQVVSPGADVCELCGQPLHRG